MMRVAMLTVLIFVLIIAPPAAAKFPDPCVSTVSFYMDWNWDWDGFKKFWNHQLGKTTGVIGTVMLVVGVGMLIIMSAKHKS